MLLMHLKLPTSLVYALSIFCNSKFLNPVTTTPTVSFLMLLFSYILRMCLRFVIKNRLIFLDVIYLPSTFFFVDFLLHLKIFFRHLEYFLLAIRI